MNNRTDIPPFGFATWQEFDEWNYQDSLNWEPTVDENGNYVPPKYGADPRYARTSKSIGQVTQKCEDDCFGFNFNLERMQEAIDSPSYAPPESVETSEQLGEWLKELANNTDEQNEKYLSKKENLND